MRQRAQAVDQLWRISRRSLLLSLPALVAGRAAAQSPPPRLAARDLNHLTIAVSDPGRSLEFYQRVLGMPVQARQGAVTLLRIGAGPQFLAIGAAGANPPGITHLCLTVDDFAVDRVLGVLAAHGVTPADDRGGGLSGGAMKVRVRRRGPEAGGAPGGTPEIYVGDPDGIVVQLQDPRYCGGRGAAGEICDAVETAPAPGLLAVEALNHFTMRVPDAARANAFYQALFGLPIRSYQGPTAPTLAIGEVGFLMYSGRRSVTAAAIDHVCFNMKDFAVDRVTAALERAGIRPRGTAAPGPLQWYVSMRGPERGGATQGTPELYFTDPDGIPIQLQDVSYCGGSGVLGDVCGA
ncbi:MAG: VOC family protein [Vicinamibacterales bacterium]